MRVKSKLTLDCNKTLNSLAKVRAVELLWIPGHNGLRSNKTAVHLARLGAGQRNMAPEAVESVYYSHVKDFFRLWEQDK